MGNCIDVQKPVLWVDDEGWESEEEEPESPAHCRGKRKAESATAGVLVAAPAGSKEKGDEVLMEGSTTTEIKIKISKKQLQELLRQVEEKGLPLSELLADLLVIGDQICLDSCKRDDDYHWRPNLQSIPEISE